MGLVETLLRKYLWTVDLGVIALCATFLGMAASGAVDSRLADVKPAAKTVAKAPPKPETRSTFNKDPLAILKRNIFCSTCPPLIEEAKATDPAVPLPDPLPQKSVLPLSIMAIMFAPPPNGYRWSVAVLRDTEFKTTGAYGVKGVVRDAEITEILETRVYLMNQGKLEYIDMFEPPPPPPAPVAKAAEPAAPAAPADPFAAEMQKGIKKLGEHNYELRRNTLESVLGNMALLSRSARIVPEVKDGKAAGFRLFAVRPDGPFALIGMQNGDIISAINGLDITSPEKALEVYSKLKSASHLSLGMERNGQKITKEYKIR